MYYLCNIYMFFFLRNIHIEPPIAEDKRVWFITYHLYCVYRRTMVFFIIVVYAYIEVFCN